MTTSPFGNSASQYASAGTSAGSASTSYGAYSMNANDFVYSLMPYLWAKFVPALRARGLPFRHVLDVTETVATTGAVAKVTVAQNLTARNLSDGSIKALDDTPPLVAEVVLTDDIYVAFGLTDVVAAFINGQPTLPAVVNGAVFGLLNAIESQLVTDIVNNVPVGNVVGTYGTAATEATFIAAQNALVAAYAPQEDYTAFLAPTAGAWGSLIQLPRVTYAQVRDASSKSMTLAPGESYGQAVRYNGGEWFQSQSVPAPTVSSEIYSSNPVWHKQALAVAIRPPETPMAGIGVVARNFIDGPSGIALQMSWMYNKDVLASEMVLRTIVGDAPAQPEWSALIRAA